jgi:alkylhydroperoxidase family enzyme
MSTFLTPIERPPGLFWKVGYHFMRRKFGKVMTPASVFSVRMPTAFTMFYGKVGKLDKKLVLSRDTAVLIREQVATVNRCHFCMDANRASLLGASDEYEPLFEALGEYRTSPLFSEPQRAALDYATELTRDKSVTGGTFERLSRHYDERAICDIVWLVASEHMFNLSNIGLNIGSDGFCTILAAGKRAQ